MDKREWMDVASEAWDFTGLVTPMLWGCSEEECGRIHSSLAIQRMRVKLGMDEDTPKKSDAPRKLDESVPKEERDSIDADVDAAMEELRDASDKVLDSLHPQHPFFDVKVTVAPDPYDAELADRLRWAVRFGDKDALNEVRKELVARFLAVASRTLIGRINTPELREETVVKANEFLSSVLGPNHGWFPEMKDVGGKILGGAVSFDFVRPDMDWRWDNGVRKPGAAVEGEVEETEHSG